MKLFKESILLIVSFLLVFLWQQTIFSQYTIHTMAIIIFLYFILTVIQTKANKQKDFDLLDTLGKNAYGMMLLNTAIVLFVIATGGFSSMFFFLLFFFAFAIAFSFEPGAVFIFSIGTIALFLPEVLKHEDIKNIVLLFSLLLTSPIAFYFGKEHKNQQKELIKKK